MKRLLFLIVALIGFSQPLRASVPCCTVTAVDVRTGTVTAIETATGRTFEFHVANAKLLATLHAGSAVYANFSAKQVSLDGKAACCEITKIALVPPRAGAVTPVAPPASAAPRAAPAPQDPCCTITAIDSTTGVVTAKENASGKLFQFKVTDAALLKTLQAGQGIFANFGARKVSVDGGAPCCTIVGTTAAPTPGMAPPPTPPAQPPTGSGAGTKPGQQKPTTQQTPSNSNTDKLNADTSQIKPSEGTTTTAIRGATAAAPTVTAPAPSVNAPKGQPSIAAPSAPHAPPSATGHSVPPGTGFQKCCTLTASTQAIGPHTSGGPRWNAIVNSQGWAFQWIPLPNYNSYPKGFDAVAGGAPLWVNFETAQVSCDGSATICGNVIAEPLYYTQTVYLDILPIGVIYVPPGDPNANSSTTPSVIPTQVFHTTNSTSKTTSTVSIASGSPGQVLTVSLDINGPSDSTGPAVLNSQTSSQSSMLSLAASGPGGYPGLNDRVVFYVNPTYDVTYLGAWIYDGGRRVGPANPVQITKIVPHQKQPSDPPRAQWEVCSALIFELQSYAAGDTQQGDARCLNNIQSASATSGNTVKTMNAALANGPLTPAQKLILLDPMMGKNLGPTPNPYWVPSNTSRFQPIAINATDGPGHQYHWSYCATSPNYGFGDASSLMQTNSTTTHTKFTGGLSLSLNPIGIAGQIVKLAAGVDLPIPGSAVTAGDAWEIDTTVTNSAISGTEWNTTGQFGGGTVPSTQSSPCDAPGFRTTMYYDLVNHTVLFSTVPDA